MNAKIRYGLSGAVLALIAAGASAPEILDQFLDEKEGNHTTAYRDGTGIWTICRGAILVDGKPVVPRHEAVGGRMQTRLMPSNGIRRCMGGEKHQSAADRTAEGGHCVILSVQHRAFEMLHLNVLPETERRRP